MRKNLSLEKNLEKGNFASQKDKSPSATGTPQTATLVLLDADHSGRDEMNLAGNPFALLQANTKYGGAPFIRYEWERTLPNGKIVTARWDVSGHGDLGLPGPADELLYLVLLQLTREISDEKNQWPEIIHFSRYEVIERLGWDHHAKSYQNLRDAFARLQSVSIQADHAFWNPKAKMPYQSVGFHIIEDYAISEEPRGRKSRDSPTLPLSWFRWNKTLHESFESGNVRNLALTFVLSLELPTSRRLFRFLDMMRHASKPPRREFTIGVMKLRDRLGTTGYKYVSKVKEKLVTAHEELMERGYLSAVEYTKAKDGGDLVVYRFGQVQIVIGDAVKETKVPEQGGVGDKATDVSRESAFPSGPSIYPQEACLVFQALSAAEQDRLRQMARADIEPAFWDRLERPDSPMALVLWEIVVREFPGQYAAQIGENCDAKN